jgi:hypothetical protein
MKVVIQGISVPKILVRWHSFNVDFSTFFCHCCQSYNFICNRHPQWALAMAWNSCWTVGSICCHTCDSSIRGASVLNVARLAKARKWHIWQHNFFHNAGWCINYMYPALYFSGLVWRGVTPTVHQAGMCVSHDSSIQAWPFSSMLQYFCFFHKSWALPSCQFCFAAWHIQCFGALWHWIGHLAIRCYHFSFNNSLVNSSLPIVNWTSKLGPPTLLLYLR